MIEKERYDMKTQEDKLELEKSFQKNEFQKKLYKKPLIRTVALFADQVMDTCFSPNISNGCPNPSQT